MVPMQQCLQWLDCRVDPMPVLLLDAKAFTFRVRSQYQTLSDTLSSVRKREPKL